MQSLLAMEWLVGVWSLGAAWASGLLAQVESGLFHFGEFGLLAQGGDGGGGGGGGGGGAFNPFTMALPAIMVLFYFMFMRPQQQKERRYQEMIENLKENDHVVTTGGIFGVVTSVQRDAQRVTLRVDEGSGVKIRVGLWAISEVVSDEKSNRADDGGADRGKKSDTKKK